MQLNNNLFDDGTVIQEPFEDQTIKHDILGMKNVVGYATDIGKIKKGVNTGKKCFTVLVEKKVDKKELKKQDVIASKIDDLETDVVEIGKIVAPGPTKSFGSGRQATLRPAKASMSCGNVTSTAGTYGALGIRNGRKVALTNTHVCCESVRLNLSDQERDCVQAGPLDGGGLPRWGYAASAIIMPDGKTAYNDYGAIDLDDQFDGAVPETFEYGVIPTGTALIAVGDWVWKEGRTTGFTIGQITSVSATVNVGYGGDGYVVHAACILTTDMSDGGDSGSHVFKKVSGPDGPPRAGDYDITAYLFAGSSTTTVLHDIHNALNALSTTLVTAEEPPSNNEIEINVTLKKIVSNDSFLVFGEVSDEATGEPIEGCLVTIQDIANSEEYTGSTDANGEYVVENIPKGYNYDAEFNAGGYEVKTLNIGTV